MQQHEAVCEYPCVPALGFECDLRPDYPVQGIFEQLTGLGHTAPREGFGRQAKALNSSGPGIQESKLQVKCRLVPRLLFEEGAYP